MLIQKPLVTTLFGYKHGKPTRDMKRIVPVCNEKKYNIHTRFTQTDTGLDVMKEHLFIAASPELLRHSECHGDGVCEIKCPIMFDRLRFGVNDSDIDVEVNQFIIITLGFRATGMCHGG